LRRGRYDFDVTTSGDLLASEENADLLRRLWLDRSLIQGEALGPGDPGDFDHGAWHVACHLIAASGVRRATDGRLLWLEVSHSGLADAYYASVSVVANGETTTVPIDSLAGIRLLESSTLLGFVEGSSLGHISARGAQDTATRFNGCPRQQYDKDVGSLDDGGKVWEHWCTTRDIRPSEATGSSVVSAYLALAAALGDQFAATVSRGRLDYGHPLQLAAMVIAGFVSEAAATCDICPFTIPASLEHLLLEADARRGLEVAHALSWATQPRYYMFQRRFNRWSDAARVRRALAAFVS
jgi:hypothetical protein